MFSDAFAPWHIVIILVILVLLFGSTKLPGAARSVGRSMRIFKAEMKGLSGDEEDSQQAQQQQQPPQAFAPPAQVMPPTPNVQDVPQGQQQSQEHSSI